MTRDRIAFPHGSFLHDLRAWARDSPDQAALVAMPETGTDAEIVTYASLERRVEQSARALRRVGLRRGDTVALILPSVWQLPVLILACLRAGLVVCPIAPTCPDDELRHRLRLTRSRILVTGDDWREDPALSGLPALERVVSAEAVLSAGDGELSASDALGADEPFAVLFTSGTTGPSKGVVHTQSTIRSALAGYLDALGMEEGTVLSTCSALTQYSGFAQGLLAVLMCGGTLVFHESFDAGAMIRASSTFSATLLYGSPRSIEQIVDSYSAESGQLDSVHDVVIGVGPVLPRLEAAIDGAFSACVHSLWGMSECGPVTLTRRSDPRGWATRSNGTPIEGMEVRVQPAAEAGRQSAGPLSVRGPGLFRGYLGPDGSIEAPLDPDGWFATGDISREDGRGGHQVIGRVRDAVVRAGAFAPIVQLEALCLVHPLIEDAAALRGEDDRIALVLVPREADGPRPTDAEVCDHLRSNGIPDVFLPDLVHWVVDLPKTATGKVRKGELSSLMAVGSAAAGARR